MCIKFRNRVFEIEQIRNPASPPLAVIDAPAGYGKTFLLQEIQRVFEQEDHWKCAFVDLDKFSSKAEIRNEIVAQIGGGSIQSSDEADADEQLKIKIARSTDNTILLFDGVRPDGPFVNWLRLLMSDYSKVIKRIKVRAIFAGRYITTGVNKLKWPRFKLCILTPFTQEIVSQLIEDTAKQDNLTTFSHNDYADWAKQIITLSCGHPKIIHNLVKKLRDHGWAIAFNDFLYRKRLFEQCADREMNEILQNLKEDSIRKALEILSIFRVFNFNTVTALQVREELSGSNPISVISSLGLVTRESTSGSYSDAIVRKLILTKMNLFEPDRYFHLNRVAQGIYGTWIDKIRSEHYSGLGESPIELIQNFVKESIYHASQLVPGFGGQEFSFSLKKASEVLIHFLEENKNDPNHKIFLKELLSCDDDISVFFEENPQASLWFEQAFERSTSSTSSAPNFVSPQIRTQYESVIMAIVNPENSGTPIMGTGFLVRYNNCVYAVTCAHVINGLGKKEGDTVKLRPFNPASKEWETEVVWYCPPSQGKENEWTANEDISILKLKETSTISALQLLPLDDADYNLQTYQRDANFLCFGFPKTRVAKGCWFNHLVLKENAAGGFVVLTNKGQPNIEPGVSGTPLCHVQTTKIIGMIQSTYGETTYMIPSKAILEVLSQLPT